MKGRGDWELTALPKPAENRQVLERLVQHNQRFRGGGVGRPHQDVAEGPLKDGRHGDGMGMAIGGSDSVEMPVSVESLEWRNLEPE
jgi:hypothetical protein